MLMVVMGPEDFETSYEQRQQAVHKSAQLVAEVEEVYGKIVEQQNKFDVAKRSATANLKNAELEFSKLEAKVMID